MGDSIICNAEDITLDTGRHRIDDNKTSQKAGGGLRVRVTALHLVGSAIVLKLTYKRGTI